MSLEAVASQTSALRSPREVGIPLRRIGTPLRIGLHAPTPGFGLAAARSRCPSEMTNKIERFAWAPGAGERNCVGLAVLERETRF